MISSDATHFLTVNYEFCVNASIDIKGEAWGTLTQSDVVLCYTPVQLSKTVTR